MDKTIEELDSCPKHWCYGKGVSKLWCATDSSPIYERIYCDRCGVHGDSFLQESGDAVKQWNDRELTGLEKAVIESAIEKRKAHIAVENSPYLGSKLVPISDMYSIAADKETIAVDALIEARAKQEPTE